MSRRATMAATLAIWIAVMIAAPAAAVTIGDPVSSPAPPRAGDPDTYKLQELRVADPDGGPPWGVATFSGAPVIVNRRSIDLGCVEVGRIVAGRIGGITPEGVFRPYVPMQGLFTFCTGLDPRAPGFAIGNALRLQPALLGPPCSLGPLGPGLPGRECNMDDQRTIVVAGLGRGILGASLVPSKPARAVSTSRDGIVLAVMRGAFTEATEPTLRVRATLCGPDARTDIGGSHRRSCEVTFDIPDVRPAAESVASKRNRRATTVVDAPVRIVERTGTSSIGRFSARLKVPITVRSSAEGYAYRLTGPTGRTCSRVRTADATSDPISSFLMVQGRAYTLPILPLDLRRGGWCKGTYRLVLYFSDLRKRTKKRVAATTIRVAR